MFYFIHTEITAKLQSINDDVALESETSDILNFKQLPEYVHRYVLKVYHKNVNK